MSKALAVALVLLALHLRASAAARLLGVGQQRGRYKGHKFGFKAEGGARAFMKQLQADEPVKVENIINRSKFPGDATKLAELLAKDAELGLDLTAEALVFRCEGLAANFSETLSAAEVASGVAAGDADPLTSEAFQLSSRPNATKKIYLDFLGGPVSGTAWNAYYGAALNIPAYDKDGIAGFSPSELSDIVAIWRAVAEDYAPFDVDITTIPPATYNTSNLRVMIGGDGAWYGSAGGVAYVGSFGQPYYQPAFVFPQMLGPNYAKYVWEAVSHEIGHTLGLYHDGTASSAYYGGVDGGNFAPIMGVGYYKPLTQFDKGEYTGSNNQQDDIAVISQTLPLIQQEAGSTIATATPMTATISGVNGTAKAAGIITRPGIPEVFSFQAGAGAATINVNVTAAWAGSVGRSNLDVKLDVMDAAGTTLGSFNPVGVNTADGLGVLAATVTLPIDGTYYISVSGAGSGDPTAAGYSSYGSRGQFAVMARFTAPAAATPSPSPATPSPSPAAVDIISSPSPAPPAVPSPSPAPPAVASPSPAPPAVPSPSPAPPAVASPSPAPPAVPSPSPSPPTSTQPLAIVNIVMSKSCMSNKCTCQARVDVKAALTNAAINYATIYGQWTSNPAAWSPNPATKSGSTSTRGYVQFTAPARQTGSATGSATSCMFEVNRALPPTGYLFDPSSVLSAVLMF